MTQYRMSPDEFKKILESKQSHSKYHSTKSGGYASKKEHRRALLLHQWEKEGKISNLREQVKYELIPAQFGECGTDFKGKPVRPLLEYSCSYIADFVYEIDGVTVVEDTKGVRTKEYIIKRKLMLWRYGIRIREI